MKTQQIKVASSGDGEVWRVVIHHAETEEEHAQFVKHLLRNTTYNPDTIEPGYTLTLSNKEVFVALSSKASRREFLHELVHVAARLTEFLQGWSEKQLEELKADLIPQLGVLCGLFETEGSFELEDTCCELRIADKSKVKTGWSVKSQKEKNEKAG